MRGDTHDERRRREEDGYENEADALYFLAAAFLGAAFFGAALPVAAALAER